MIRYLERNFPENIGLRKKYKRNEARHGHNAFYSKSNGVRRETAVTNHSDLDLLRSTFPFFLEIRQPVH